MSFNGTFFYLWDENMIGQTPHWVAFPNKYIFKESYTGALEVQDLDSTRNANGKLKRNVLDHTAFTINFSTPPCYNKDMNKIFRDFINKYYMHGHEKERKLKVRFYVNEIDEYEEGEFYVATPKFNVNWVKGNEIFYKSVAISMIQY